MAENNQDRDLQRDDSDLDLSHQEALSELSRKDPKELEDIEEPSDSQSTSDLNQESQKEKEGEENKVEEKRQAQDLKPASQDFSSFGAYQQALSEQKDSILQSIDALPPEKRAIYDRDIAQMKELIRRNRMSNYILLLLIVLYLILLFFLNNWIFLAVVCVAMVGLVIWDHFSLKKLKAIRKEINELGVLPTPQGSQTSDKPIASLNQLPKEYTVLDQVDIDGTDAEHIVLSTHGVMVISKTDLAPAVADILAVEPSNVIWIDDLYPLERQVEMILERQETVFSEPEVMQQAYTLSRLTE